MNKQKNKFLVGTNKGLVLFSKTANGWKIERDFFLGFPVSITNVDKRTNTWWACLAHRHWGQKLHRSFDEGRTWEAIDPPKYPKGAEIKKGLPASLKNVWAFAEGGSDRPNEIYFGTEPGGLFHSKDNGDNLELVKGLWDHPSRMKDWFGAGRDHPYIHSIIVDPRNSDHLYIAISCAGVFETTDGGQIWEPRNEGLRADYLPVKNARIGHDPHMMIACESNSDIIWQQNQCGIFRTTNGGQSWNDITDKNGLANYGFALGIDHQHTERAWVIPAISDEIRVASDKALCVCRTEDGGQNWEPLRDGLPQEYCYDLVFRHALAVSDNLLVFGTTNGNVYLSEDYGDHWTCLHQNLPRVNCIEFV